MNSLNKTALEINDIPSLGWGLMHVDVEGTIFNQMKTPQPPKICGIYKITSPTGKIYIGQSPDIESRFKRYKKLDCERQPKIYASLRYHSVEKHIFEIIEECLQEELNNKEVTWIAFYNSFDTPHGMNLTLGGGGSQGFKHSEESKKKQSLIAKARPPKTKEEIERIAKTLKDKYSKVFHPSKGSIQTPEHIAKRIAKNRGKKRTKATRELQRESSAKAKWVLNVETGIYYQGTYAAAESAGLPKDTLRSRLSGRLKNNTSFIYV